MPNKPAAPNAGIALRWIIEHLWPGVGEPMKPNSKSFREQAGPVAKQLQCVCHDTLPRLISFSSGLMINILSCQLAIVLD